MILPSGLTLIVHALAIGLDSGRRRFIKHPRAPRPVRSSRFIAYTISLSMMAWMLFGATLIVRGALYDHPNTEYVMKAWQTTAVQEVLHNLCGYMRGAVQASVIFVSSPSTPLEIAEQLRAHTSVLSAPTVASEQTMTAKGLTDWQCFGSLTGSVVASYPEQIR